MWLGNRQTGSVQEERDRRGRKLTWGWYTADGRPVSRHGGWRAISWDPVLPKARLTASTTLALLG